LGRNQLLHATPAKTKPTSPLKTYINKKISIKIKEITTKTVPELILNTTLMNKEKGHSVGTKKK
jgi:hypothetical protein